MTNSTIPERVPVCICGRPLAGDMILVCGGPDGDGCHRNAADCRCRGILAVTATLPAPRPGGLFGKYQAEIIHDPRADSRAD